jgi:hypothetical protein
MSLIKQSKRDTEPEVLTDRSEQNETRIRIGFINESNNMGDVTLSHLNDTSLNHILRDFF